MRNTIEVIKLKYFKAECPEILRKFSIVRLVCSKQRLEDGTPGCQFTITCNGEELGKHKEFCRVDDWGDSLVDYKKWSTSLEKGLQDSGHKFLLEERGVWGALFVNQLYTLILEKEAVDKWFCDSLWDYIKYKFKKLFKII